MNSIIIFGANYLYIIVALVAVIYFLLESPEKRRKIFILGIISLPIIYAIAKIVALFYYDPRPFVAGNFIPLIPHAADNGFPSDHELFTAAISSVVFTFNKKIGSLLWALSVLVGISRIAAGIHSLTDIVGAIVIAIAVTWVVYILIGKKLGSIFNKKSTSGAV